MSDTIYDVIIIGGSVAAATAGVYAARRGLKFKVIAKDFGGEVATSGEIGNWPGINQTDGITLSQSFRAQLEFNKADMEEGIEVASITKQARQGGQGEIFCITAKKHGEVAMASDKLVEATDKAPTCDYQARAVIVATGVHPRELTVPGEKEYRNKGVSYCTVCDGPLFGGKVTAVVGGGNSALESALMLADISSKVYVINKNAEFKGEQVLIDNLKLKSNVQVITNATTTAIKGTNLVSSLVYTDASGEHSLDVEGIFVHIGMIPNSYIIPAEAKKDEFGQVEVDAHCATSLPGLFAAGDVTNVPFKQIVIAAGQGCIALLSAVAYLNRTTHEA